ncbi:hypothetical protein D3C86_2233580 [compost metagenome]
MCTRSQLDDLLSEAVKNGDLLGCFWDSLPSSYEIDVQDPAAAEACLRTVLAALVGNASK